MERACAEKVSVRGIKGGTEVWRESDMQWEINGKRGKVFRYCEK